MKASQNYLLVDMRNIDCHTNAAPTDSNMTMLSECNKSVGGFVPDKYFGCINVDIYRNK